MNTEVIIFIVVLIFNIGGFAGMYLNHSKHLNDAIKKIESNISDLFSIANSNRERVSKIEGRLNGS